MAEASEKDSRTEEATPKKLEDMRRDGKAPKSQDVGSAAVLVAAVVMLSITGPGMVRDMRVLALRSFTFSDLHRPMQGLMSFGQALGSALVPLMLMLMAAAVVSGLVQTGGLFLLSQAAPKFERLDPIKGSSRILPGPETLGELGKMILKVGLLGGVAYSEISGAAARLAALAHSPAEVGAAEIGDLGMRVVLKIAVAFVVIAAIDYALAYRRFREEGKMTKQEIKDEHKQQEGDPAIKGKRRARARQMARQRSVAEVKNATVLVVNPTHIAIAIRYRPGQDAAPMVLAKGVEETALRMRDAAREAKVPIIENRPLARAMHLSAKVGRAIPVELYESAARVIAHVLSLKRGGAAAAPAPGGEP